VARRGSMGNTSIIEKGIGNRGWGIVEGGG